MIRSISSIRNVVGASVLGTTLLTVPAWGQELADTNRLGDNTIVHTIETDVATLKVSIIPVDDPKRYRVAGAAGGGGACPQVKVQHTEDQFFEEGATVALQAGIIDGEAYGASYTLAADQFPLQFKAAETVWGQNHVNSTTTQWAITIWEGFPGSGTILFTESTLDGILPPLTLPAQGGATFAIIRVEVDPGDPEQINISNNGTSTFSVTWDVVALNQNTTFPCIFPPPANQNAFPATDSAQPDTPDVPTGNWLFAVNCGLSCPGGWDRFSDCPSLLPGGDWVTRAFYQPLACGDAGACCFTDGSCQQDFSGGCTSAGGVFQGSGVECAPNPCPQPPGACCLPTGCQELDQTVCLNAGGQFVGGTCNSQTCLGACCVPDGGLGQCFTLFSEGDCGVISGTFLGAGSDCMGVVCFPTGACCINGTCFDGFSPTDCVNAGGDYQGDGVDCMTVTCPEPTGACCFAGGVVCNQQTQAACETLPTNVWLGPGTTCDPGACDDAPPCPWDCAPDNGDGTFGNQTVNIDDLLNVINAFGDPGGPCDNAPDNGDGTFGNGTINIDDLLGVINNFGDCPM
ncbi:MAG: hypothetical protein AAF432_06055 [Planctomycetota bacterium]